MLFNPPTPLRQLPQRVQQKASRVALILLRLDGKAPKKVGFSATSGLARGDVDSAYRFSSQALALDVARFAISLLEPYVVDPFLKGTWLLDAGLRFMGADVSYRALVLDKVSDRGMVKV